jgi:hypothetical protein
MKFLLKPAIIAGKQSLSVFLIKSFKKNVYKRSGLKERTLEIQVPPPLTGIFERYMAALLVVMGVGVASLGTVLLAWMAAKIAANWQRRAGRGNTKEDQRVRAYTLVALMSGTLSLGIGITAGLAARYSFCAAGLISFDGHTASGSFPQMSHIAKGAKQCPNVERTTM